MMPDMSRKSPALLCSLRFPLSSGFFRLDWREMIRIQPYFHLLYSPKINLFRVWRLSLEHTRFEYAPGVTRSEIAL